VSRSAAARSPARCGSGKRRACGSARATRSRREIEVTRLVEIDLADVTEDLAHRGGFADLDDLMTVARHGRGERVFLVEFHYLEAGA
jgi:hypothetical protein